MSATYEHVRRASDLTADIDLMKKPDGDIYTLRSLCMFKKKPRSYFEPPHTVLIIEGLNENQQHYFYEIDFVPTYSTSNLWLPSDLLQQYTKKDLSIYIPWYLTIGKVRVRGHNIDFNFFNISQPDNAESYGYLPRREPNTLNEFLRTKTRLEGGAMLICAIDKQTESALLEDIKADFLRNDTTNPLIYNFRGITVTPSSSIEENSATTVNQAIQRFINHFLEVADYHHGQGIQINDGQAPDVPNTNVAEGDVYRNYSVLLERLSGEQKDRLQEMIQQEQLQPSPLQLSGSGHNCMTWIEEKVGKQGIDINWDFSSLLKVIDQFVHHPDKVSMPADISRETYRYGFFPIEQINEQTKRELKEARERGQELTDGAIDQIFANATIRNHELTRRAQEQEEEESASTGWCCVL